jgi:hypothetical protein
MLSTTAGLDVLRGLGWWPVILCLILIIISFIIIWLWGPVIIKEDKKDD